MCNHKLVSKEDYIQIVSAIKSGDVCTSVIQVDIPILNEGGGGCRVLY